MGQYVVYADVLFIVNFLLDLALLFGTAHFGNFNYRRIRLLLSASLGGIYGVGILYPQFEILYLFPCKLGFSLLIIWCAFGTVPFKRFLRQLCYFYAISFAMAGAALGFSALLKNYDLAGFGFRQINTGTLIFAVIAALILARWGVSHLKRNWQKEALSIRAELHFGRRKIDIPVFLDTGNDLCDPLSGRLVMVAEYQALHAVLPSGFCRLYERYADGDVVRMLEKHSAAAAGFNLRLIPFSAIGTVSGMLIGIMPDQVVFYGKEKIVLHNLLVGLYHRPLNNLHGCKAFVNPAALTSEAEEGERLWA